MDCQYKSEKFRKLERLIVTLHGYGFEGSDFVAPVMQSFGKEISNTLFLFPDAPIDCGEQFDDGKKWFNLSKDVSSYEEITVGLGIAAPQLFNDVIENASVEYSVPYENIDIIGFSQGAMLAFDMIYYANFGHIIAYSGIFVPRLENTRFLNNRVFIVHGDEDPVIDYKYLSISAKKLTLMGVENKTFICHGAGHMISYDGLQKGVEFIKYD
jgi:phospholipase/carboxylesterase